MSEPGAAPTSPGSAGAQLRAARERQGMHVAALAAAIKIPQRRLEALEADRYDELPDATFARALALTVCRALKIDPAPVLAQLPRIGDKPLPDVAGGLNAPYRERSGRAERPAGLAPLRHPLSWAALLVLLAAALVLWLPEGGWRSLLSDSTATPASATTASAAMPAVASVAAAASSVVEEIVQAAAAPASAVVVEVVHASSADPAAASAVAAAPVAGLAVLRASNASWVEVIDAAGQVLLQRVLQPGESVGLDGRLPLRLKIGNAAVTSLQFRGREVDLAPHTRDNVARLELK